MEKIVVANEVEKMRAWSQVLSHAERPCDAMTGLGMGLLVAFEILMPELDYHEVGYTVYKVQALATALYEHPRATPMGEEDLKALVDDLAGELAGLADALREQSLAV